MKVLSTITSKNEYLTRNWDTEYATRYVIGFAGAIVEASYFSHYLGETHVKHTIELPTSFGCPVGCQYCASGAIEDTRQLSSTQQVKMLQLIAEQHGLARSDAALVTFTGIGEGWLQRHQALSTCRASLRILPNARFTFATVGLWPQYFKTVESWATEIKVHYVQVTYVHTLRRMFEAVVPLAARHVFSWDEVVQQMHDVTGICPRVNYVVIDGFNTSDLDVQRFIESVRGLEERIVVRVSRLNRTTPGVTAGLRSPTIERVRSVAQSIAEAGFTSYPFAAAVDDNLNCGQLAWSYQSRKAMSDSV